ncbi:MAG TPA: hypothetical protein VHV49_19915, partial [Pseudonocardiaceae bacterium]|nr:hypothetical protein [Pseudonocardiaceae bacterium]
REALTAAQWSIAGVDPDTVGDWFAAKITVGEAIRWHEFGFTLDEAKANLRNGKGPDDAYRDQQRMTNVPTSVGGGVTSLVGKQIKAFLNSGVGHDMMGGYLQAQWTDSEAVTWAKAGVQAWDARAWQTIGLLPAEAGELAKAKKKPAEVMRDWWRAGIPFDEMADWLGAGLTPEEAVAQRESGVTVEQAAALRALRRGGSA